MEKILFEVEDSAESLWAEQVGPNRFRLDNIPFYLYGISCGDIVEAEPVEETKMLLFSKLIEKCGNRTIRVYTECPEIHEEEFKPVLDGIVGLECVYEGFAPRMISINIPPHVQWGDITDFLNERGLMWESGDPQFRDEDA